MMPTFLNRRYTGDDGGFFSGSLGESLKRFCWALLTGFLATAFLFFLMHSLISKGDIEIIDAKEVFSWGGRPDRGCRNRRVVHLRPEHLQKDATGGRRQSGGRLRASG